jgi:hypothetical protein
MSIIRQTDWQPPVTTTFPTVQDLRENPDGPYRELLMAEDENGEAVPYQYIGIVGGTVVYVRIPHALSIGALGTQVDAASVAHSRIPDVVIPLVVENVDPDLGLSHGAVDVRLVWDATQALTALDGRQSSTGIWADENFVYLALRNVSAATADVSFVVYVEYTHSVIRNEIVTADYATLAFG